MWLINQLFGRQSNKAPKKIMWRREAFVYFLKVAFLSNFFSFFFEGVYHSTTQAASPFSKREISKKFRVFSLDNQVGFARCLNGPLTCLSAGCRI